MFIAKKLKTAIYTLFAVLLIATSAFSGAAARAEKDTSSDTPWGWAHNIRAERLARENVGMDTELLAQLLNELNEADFSVRSDFIDGTLALTINDNGQQCLLAIEENSALVTLNLGGHFWDIRSPRLFRFIRSTVAGIPVEEIELELQSDVPPEIIDYATEYISERIKGYYEKWSESEIEDPFAPCFITKAKITALTRIDTGTVGSEGGEELYRLEYRLKASGNIDAVLVDGMRAEDGWITEWDSTGQPYLLLHWENIDDEPVGELVCFTNTEEITSVYGTPEMLSQYDDAYTAAVIGLYEAYNESMKTVVHVAYADEELLARSDELEQFMDYDSEYQVKLVFTTDSPLKEFKFLGLSFVDYDDEKGAQFDVEELYHVGELLPQRPLVIGMTFVGSMPDRGISFVDAEGAVKYYGIYQSGKDGSPQLSEFKK